MASNTPSTHSLVFASMRNASMKLNRLKTSDSRTFPLDFPHFSLRGVRCRKIIAK